MAAVEEEKRNISPPGRLSAAEAVRLNAKFKKLGAAMAAGLNYNAAKAAAGDNPSPEQAAELARLRAELEAANKA